MKPDFNPWPGHYRKCYAIAIRAHRGQFYGGHLSYFKAHVLPLAEFFKKRGMYREACLALLHDTIEDHPDKVTYNRLAIAGIPEEIRTALRCITKERGEVYATYLARVMSNDLAWRVKIRDVLANASAPGATRHRLLTYARALQILVPNAPDNVLT
jgi:hypothetical protein